MVEGWILRQRQNNPLEVKEAMTRNRIKQFSIGRDPYVSFSGGKDSTVLLDIAWKCDPSTKAVYIDTGLEYPEIKDFVKSKDVKIITPKISHHKVIKKYGYPVISKMVSMALDRYRNTKDPRQKELRLNGGINPTSGKIQKTGVIPKKWRFLINAPFKCSDRCCYFMKKEPANRFHKKTGMCPITGEMASDSNLRQQQYLKHGCNQFDKKIPKSTPLGFWFEKDIWDYIKKYNLEYSEIYDKGETRTGCIYCMFGIQKDYGRFERLKVFHETYYNYCMDQLGNREVIDYIKQGKATK